MERVWCSVYRLRKAHNPASVWREGGRMDFKLWLKYMTLIVNASQTLHSATSKGTTSITTTLTSKGLANCFLARRLIVVYGAATNTLAQTNPMHRFRAPRFPTQPANNQRRTQQSHFRGPQDSNN